MGLNKANIATKNEASAYRFLAINSFSSSLDLAGAVKSIRKSEHIDAALNLLPTGSNPTTVFTIPCLRARFAAKGQC